MTRLAPIPDNAVQCGTNFYVPPALKDPTASGLTYLVPGETEWWGPYPTRGDYAAHFRWDLRNTKDCAVKLRRSGIHLQVQGVGTYIRTRCLREGPAKKLSDWKQLVPGESMLVNPTPSAEDIERAMTRVKYTREKRFGRFRSWTDQDGALWVTCEEVAR